MRLKCPNCGGHKCEVIDTRELDIQLTEEELQDTKHEHIDVYKRRRYQCQECKTRFTTYESTIDVKSISIPSRSQKLVDMIQPTIKRSKEYINVDDVYRVISNKYKQVVEFAQEQSKLGNTERSLEYLYKADGIKCALQTLDSWLVATRRLDNDIT